MNHEASKEEEGDISFDYQGLATYGFFSKDPSHSLFGFKYLTASTPQKTTSPTSSPPHNNTTTPLPPPPERENQLQIRQESLTRTEADLAHKEKQLLQRECVLATDLENLSKTLAGVKSKEEEVAKKEGFLKREVEEANSKYQSIQTILASIEKEHALISKAQMTLTQREKDLSKKETEIQQKIDELKAVKASADQTHDVVEKESRLLREQEARVDQLQHKLESTKNLLDEKRRALEQQEKESQKAQDVITKKHIEISNHEKDLNAQELAFSAAKHVFDSQKKSVAVAELMLQRREEQLALAESESRSIRAKLSEAERRCAEKIAELDKFKVQLDHRASSLSQQEMSLAQQQAKLSANTEETDSIKRDLKIREKAVKSREEEYNNWEAVLETKEGELNTAKQKLEVKEASLVNQENVVFREKANVKEWHDRVVQKEKELGNFKADLQSKIVKLEAWKLKAEAHLDVRTREADEKASQLEQREGTVKAAEVHLANRVHSIEQIDRDTATKTKQLELLENDMTHKRVQLNQQKADFESKKKVFMESTKVREAQMAEHKDQYEWEKQRLAKEDRANVARREQLERLAAKAEQEREQIREKENELANKKRELSTSIEELHREMEKHEIELTERFGIKEKQVEAAKMELMKREIELGNLKRDLLREVEDMKRNLAAEAEMIRDEMQRRLSETQAAQKQTADREVSLNVARQELSKEITVMKSSISKREGELDQMFQETELVRQEMARKEVMLEKLAREVEAAGAELAKREQEINLKKKHLDQKDSEMKTIESHYESVRKELQQREAGVKAGEKDVEEMRKDISNRERDLKEMENSVARYVDNADRTRTDITMRMKEVEAREEDIYKQVSGMDANMKDLELEKSELSRKWGELDSLQNEITHRKNSLQEDHARFVKQKEEYDREITQRLNDIENTEIRTQEKLKNLQDEEKRLQRWATQLGYVRDKQKERMWRLNEFKMQYHQQMKLLEERWNALTEERKRMHLQELQQSQPQQQHLNRLHDSSYLPVGEVQQPQQVRRAAQRQPHADHSTDVQVRKTEGQTAPATKKQVPTSTEDQPLLETNNAQSQHQDNGVDPEPAPTPYQKANLSTTKPPKTQPRNTTPPPTTSSHTQTSLDFDPSQRDTQAPQIVVEFPTTQTQTQTLLPPHPPIYTTIATLTPPIRDVRNTPSPSNPLPRNSALTSPQTLLLQQDPAFTPSPATSAAPPTYLSPATTAPSTASTPIEFPALETPPSVPPPAPTTKPSLSSSPLIVQPPQLHTLPIVYENPGHSYGQIQTPSDFKYQVDAAVQIRTMVDDLQSTHAGSAERLHRLRGLVKSLEEQISVGGADIRRTAALKKILQQIDRLQLELDAITLDENDNILSDSFFLKSSPRMTVLQRKVDERRRAHAQWEENLRRQLQVVRSLQTSFQESYVKSNDLRGLSSPVSHHRHYDGDGNNGASNDNNSVAVTENPPSQDDQQGKNDNRPQGTRPANPPANIDNENLPTPRNTFPQATDSFPSPIPHWSSSNIGAIDDIIGADDSPRSVPRINQQHQHSEQSIEFQSFREMVRAENKMEKSSSPFDSYITGGWAPAGMDPSELKLLHEALDNELANGGEVDDVASEMDSLEAKCIEKGLVLQQCSLFLRLQVEGSAEWLKARLQLTNAERDLAAAQGALRALRTRGVAPLQQNK